MTNVCNEILNIKFRVYMHGSILYIYIYMYIYIYFRLEIKQYYVVGSMQMTFGLKLH